MKYVRLHETMGWTRRQKWKQYTFGNILLNQEGRERLDDRRDDGGHFEAETGQSFKPWHARNENLKHICLHPNKM
jgi:hypothetical protein